MVFQQTIENLRERPHDERRAVAGGIAIGVVVILFLGWAFIFLHDLNSPKDYSAPPVQTNTAANASSSTFTSPDQQPALEWQGSTTTGGYDTSTSAQ